MKTQSQRGLVAASISTVKGERLLCIPPLGISGEFVVKVSRSLAKYVERQGVAVVAVDQPATASCFALREGDRTDDGALDGEIGDVFGVRELLEKSNDRE